jgi:hypothetical protein
MRRHLLRLGAFGAAAAVLAGCAAMPAGPSVLVLPGTGKSFEQFQADEMNCRNYADYQIGGQSAQAAANQSAIGSAALGTAIGALAGAAVGGGRGAGVGAGGGLLVGSAAGTGASQASGYDLQRRYDYAYIQCMYAKGDRVPVSGTMSDGAGASPRPSFASPPAPVQRPSPGWGQGSIPPPPPAGTPPAPPPGVLER